MEEKQALSINECIEKTLMAQLQLLHERSQNPAVEASDLAAITESMAAICRVLYI